MDPAGLPRPVETARIWRSIAELITGFVIHKTEKGKTTMIKSIALANSERMTRVGEDNPLVLR